MPASQAESIAVSSALPVASKSTASSPALSLNGACSSSSASPEHQTTMYPPGSSTVPAGKTYFAPSSRLSDRP